MKFRRDELAARAQAAVELILTTLAEQRLIPAFIEDYAKAQERPELLESPLRYRELVHVLTREALLTISSRLTAALPRRLLAGRGQREGGAEGKALETFREEYFFHLAKVMRWTPAELEEFYNDFELLQMIQLRQQARPGEKPRAKGKAGPRPKDSAGPFADRAALLLDPSFMEKARAAAAQFEPRLRAAAERVLAAVLRPTVKKTGLQLFP
jgi:hypothetical protein